MPAAVAPKLLTAEEFALLPEPSNGTKLDLVKGEVIAVSRPNWEHGEIQLNVGTAIRNYLRTNPIGRAAVESGVLTDRDPDTVRGPDVSFMSKARMPLNERMNTFAPLTPDLCVEVLSPSNTNREVQRKVKDYFFNGARMVWVLDPDVRSVTVYREPLEGRVISEGKSVDGGDVLPGFLCPVADFFT